jgi:uncharacterized membrane protein
MTEAPPDAADRSAERRAVAIALIVTVAGFALRFANLTVESIWIDENASITQASLDFVGMLRATAHDNYPPLHNMFLFASLRLFGDGEFGARFPSAVFGALTVPVMFAIGRELFRRVAGLVAAILFAVAPFQLDYAQEARMYSLLAFCAALSLYAFLVMLRRPTLATAGAYVLATAAMLYTHFYALFTLGVENLFFLLLLVSRRERAGRRLLRWIAIQAVVLALFLPWLRFLLRRSAAIQGDFWIPPPTLDNTLSFFRVFAGGDMLVWVELALIVIAVAAMVWSRRAAAGPHHTGDGGWALTYAEKIVLLILWLIVPVALGHALSLVLQPFLMVRYVIAASLAWYLLVAAGVVVLSGGNVIAAGVLTALLLGLTLPKLQAFYAEPRKHDWRAAVGYIRERLAPGDVILANPYFESAMALYYARGVPLVVTGYPGKGERGVEGAGRRWILSEVASDECWSAQPGPIGKVRQLLDRRIFFQAAVCLYAER